MWDDRIDQTARELTGGEPGSDFRARVLARLDGSPGSAVFGWKWAAAACATAAVIVVIGVRMYQQPVETRLVDEATRQAPDVILRAASPEAVAVVEPVVRTAEAARDRRVAVQAVEAPADVSMGAPQDVAPDVAPIFIEPIALSPVVVTSLGVTGSIQPDPLTLESIDLPPLDTNAQH